jgi:hypothetical protein
LTPCNPELVDIEDERCGPDQDFSGAGYEIQGGCKISVKVHGDLKAGEKEGNGGHGQVNDVPSESISQIVHEIVRENTTYVAVPSEAKSSPPPCVMIMRRARITMLIGKKAHSTAQRGTSHLFCHGPPGLGTLSNSSGIPILKGLT